MLPLQFFGQNLYFAINVFAGLVFIATSWLYFDAWVLQKKKKELCKWLGFFMLAVAFFISALIVESTSGSSETYLNTIIKLVPVLKLGGLILLALGLYIDPLPKVIKNEGLHLSHDQSEKPTKKRKKKLRKTKSHGVFASLGGFGVALATPLLSGCISWLYWRRATRGLEDHLKAVAFSFVFITVSFMLGISKEFLGTDNPMIYNLVAPYGVVWFAQQITLLAGAIFLGRWVWYYLTKRIFTQLFMVLTLITVSVFLVTTVSFSYLIVRNIQKDTLSTLEATAQSLKYAISSKHTETLSNAEVLGEKNDVVQAVKDKNHAKLKKITAEYIRDKKVSSIVITNQSGQVLMRAEDPDRWGESLSDDTMVQRALSGIKSSGIDTKQDVITPILFFKSSVPIYEGNAVIGSVSVGIAADNVFVDGIKEATGLDATVYSGNVRSATTLVSPNNKARLTGVIEHREAVNTMVLDQGKTYSGVIDVLNQPYLAVYTPLLDVDNVVEGMLFVGLPQSHASDTASRAIETTLLLAIVLLISSILPVYLVARYITGQLH